MSKYIIVGKAASGKDFLQTKLVELGYTPMRQYTTRSIREIETGDEYHFVDDETYMKMEQNGDFVSSNFYTIGWYGISYQELLRSNVAILSPANIRDIFSKHPEIRKIFSIIYLDVPVAVRQKRLSHRYIEKVGDDNERRMAADEQDFSGFSDFDIVLRGQEDIEEFINNLSSLYGERKS